MLHVPDITGLIEVGPVELTVSRETLADAGSPPALRLHFGADVSQRMVRDLRPAVVARTDEIHTYGMVPGRISFLRGMASAFGSEILEATKLRWIPVTLPPGDLIHHSKQEVIELLEKQTRILLAVGISPGGAYAAASSRIPMAELGKMPVLAIGREEFQVNYYAQNELDRAGHSGVVAGTLDDVILAIVEVTRSAEHYRSVSAESLTSELLLTSFLLRWFAESWSMTVQALKGQSWYLHYKDNAMYADLRRV